MNKKVNYLLGVMASLSLSACSMGNWYPQDRVEPHHRMHHKHHHGSHHKTEAHKHHAHAEKAAKHHVAKKTPVVSKKVVQPHAPGPVRQAAPQIPVIQ